MKTTLSTLLGPRRRRRRRLVRAIAVALIVVGGSLRGAAFQADEVQLRAALTVNFAKFITWPPETFETDAAPFRVAVIADDAIAAAVEKIGRGRFLGGRHIVVLRASPADDLTHVQVVFLGSLGDQRTTLVLEKLRGRPVLTVSDGFDFTTRGGMIGIVPADETYRFVVNAGALTSASLQANTSMLALAVGAEKKAR